MQKESEFDRARHLLKYLENYDTKLYWTFRGKDSYWCVLRNGSVEKPTYRNDEDIKLMVLEHFEKEGRQLNVRQIKSTVQALRILVGGTVAR
jgi:hypothetical protein